MDTIRQIPEKHPLHTWEALSQCEEQAPSLRVEKALKGPVAHHLGETLGIVCGSASASRKRRSGGLSKLAFATLYQIGCEIYADAAVAVREHPIGNGTIAAT